MPIKQERMLNLISAAEDFKQALDRAISIVKTESEHARAGRISPADALDNIELFLEPNSLMTNPVDSHSCIAVEKSIFKPHHIRANRGAALRAQRTRQASQLTAETQLRRQVENEEDL